MYMCMYVKRRDRPHKFVLVCQLTYSEPPLGYASPGVPRLEPSLACCTNVDPYLFEAARVV